MAFEQFVDSHLSQYYIVFWHLLICSISHASMRDADVRHVHVGGGNCLWAYVKCFPKECDKYGREKSVHRLCNTNTWAGLDINIKVEEKTKLNYTNYIIHENRTKMFDIIIFFLSKNPIQFFENVILWFHPLRWIHFHLPIPPIALGQALG